MNKQSSKDMVATKNKSKVLSCSTPEHQAESPSRDSDSICDSEAASPVPFLCTQDGAEGETDVVWNFYTPKSGHATSSHLKNTTPLSRRSKRVIRPKLIEKQMPKRRPIRTSQKKTEFFQELMELNQNLHELIATKSHKCLTEKQQSGSEDDVFSDSTEYSPKSAPRSTSRCLRKNVLSSNFTKPDPEAALESDDSMNECLLKASQMVEDNIISNGPTSAKRVCYDIDLKKKKSLGNETIFKMDQDSMDAILNNIKLESPIIERVKKCDSPCLNNDSFDCIVGNLNDSALERLTQMPARVDGSNRKNKLNITKDIDMALKDFVDSEGSPMSKSIFGRHNSMPESPSFVDVNKPSTSGMVFGRYSSMPYDKNNEKSTGDSPIRCTPDEIKKKHQQAREKLMAKRLLPFTASQQPATQSIVPPMPSQLTQSAASKNRKFQPKVPSFKAATAQKQLPNQVTDDRLISNSNDLKLLIEKKRQEALMKLRRRQPQAKMI